MNTLNKILKEELGDDGSSYIKTEIRFVEDKVNGLKVKLEENFIIKYPEITLPRLQIEYVEREDGHGIFKGYDLYTAIFLHCVANHIDYYERYLEIKEGIENLPMTLLEPLSISSDKTPYVVFNNETSYCIIDNGPYSSYFFSSEEDNVEVTNSFHELMLTAPIIKRTIVVDDNIETIVENTESEELSSEKINATGLRYEEINKSDVYIIYFDTMHETEHIFELMYVYSRYLKGELKQVIIVGLRVNSSETFDSLSGVLKFETIEEVANYIIDHNTIKLNDVENKDNLIMEL